MPRGGGGPVSEKPALRGSPPSAARLRRLPRQPRHPTRRHGHAYRRDFHLRALSQNATSGGGKAAAEIAQCLAGLEAAGPGSSEALARARLAVHSFNLAAIKQAAEPPAPAPAAAPKSP